MQWKCLSTNANHHVLTLMFILILDFDVGHKSSKMPTTRSQVLGGLPPIKWGTSNAQRLARDRMAELRAQEANEANAATLAILAGANRNLNTPSANRNPEVPPEADANRNPEVAVAKEDWNEADPNPCNRNTPHEVWMGVQVCGVHKEDVAKSLAKNPFVSNFSRCLKVTKEDVEDTFESSERCWPSTAG